MAFDKTREKLVKAMERYVSDNLLPISYEIYRDSLKDGVILGYEEYMKMVLDKLKGE